MKKITNYVVAILICLIITSIYAPSNAHSPIVKYDKKCTACNGSGYCGECDRDGKVKCLHCNGYGHITMYYDNLGNVHSYYTTGSFEKKISCNDCQGTGKTNCYKCNGNGRCKYCKGTGRVD